MTETSVENVNLLGLTLPKMEAFCLSIGEKKFRGAQLVKWIHQQGVTDFDQMTNLSKSFRDQLKSIAEVRPPTSPCLPSKPLTFFLWKCCDRDGP